MRFFEMRALGQQASQVVKARREVGPEALAPGSIELSADPDCLPCCLDRFGKTPIGPQQGRLVAQRDAARESIDRGQIFGEVAIDPDGLCHGLDGLFPPAQIVKNGREIVQARGKVVSIRQPTRGGEFPLEIHGFAAGFQRLLMAAEGAVAG